MRTVQNTHAHTHTHQAVVSTTDFVLLPNPTCKDLLWPGKKANDTVVLYITFVYKYITQVNPVLSIATSLKIKEQFGGFKGNNTLHIPPHQRSQYAKFNFRSDLRSKISLALSTLFGYSRFLLNHTVKAQKLQQRDGHQFRGSGVCHAHNSQYPVIYESGRVSGIVINIQHTFGSKMESVCARWVVNGIRGEVLI